MPQTDNSAPWYRKLLGKLKPKIYPIPYYKRRLMVILIASIIVYVYFVFVCASVWFWSILRSTLQIKWWWILEFFILGAIWLCVGIGSIDEEIEPGEWRVLSPSGLRSLAMLVVATFLFMTLLSLPVYLTGGAINSPFTTIIVAMAGLAVLVSTSAAIRTAIVFVCVGLYLICMFWFIEIDITSVTGHRILHIFSVLLSLGITLFLSMKAKVSFFKRGEEPGEESSATLEPAPP
jgi:hypothetical protein